MDIPEHIVEKWQSILDVMAELIGVPAALIMRVVDSEIEVFASSRSDGNPYHPGDREHLLGLGLYCETVIKTRERLLVPNAFSHDKWKTNPDIKLNMISYLGFPILLPDGEPFGTICVLDNKENFYSHTYERLIVSFREIITSHLELIHMNQVLETAEIKRKQAEDESRTLLGFPEENPHPVLRVAKDGTILYANEPGLELLNIWGCKLDQQCPESIKRLVGDSEGTLSRMNAEVEIGDRAYSFSFVPIKGGDFIYLYGEDITERKQAEESLRKTASALGKKSERLARLYELGITIGRPVTEIADKTVSIIATALDVQMATVKKIDNNTLRVVSFIRDAHIFHEGTYPLNGAPCEQVKREKEVCRYHRAKEKFPRAAFLQEHDVDTYLGVPILSSRGEVMGIINAMDRRHVDVSEEDIELLYTVSRRIAFEWEQGAKINQIKQANKTLETLYEIASTTAQSMDLNELLNNAIEVILRVDLLSLGKQAAIFLVDQEAGEIALAAQKGFSKDMEQYDRRVKMGECLCGRAALSGDTVFSLNSENDPRHTRHLPHTDAHGDICVPFIFKDRVLGVLHLDRGVDIPLSAQEVQIFEAMGNQIGVALENAMLFKQVQEYSSELEQKVDKRTREIQSINQDLLRANQAKSDFLASMSHELRTPLNSIIGFSEVLRDQYFGKLNEKQAEYTDDILKSGKHLLSLINGILDLSKVEAGKMTLEISQVNIKDLLENSLVMIKEKAFKHSIRIDIHIPEELAGQEIPADERKLRQIMFNLLSNAAKFTPDGGEIRVTANRISDLEKEGKIQSAIEVSVADSGIGINVEDQEKIFDEFYQVPGGIAGKTAGTGLGLPLTRSLVELHGGRIRVESEGEGKGSRFSFILPVKPVPVEEGKPALEAGFSPHGMETEELLLNHLSRATSLSKRLHRSFTLCCFQMNMEKLKEKGQDIPDVLKREKRDYDFLGMDKDGRIYLILTEVSQPDANDICDRFKRKLENLLEGQRVSFSIATFPEDGQSPEVLLRKVR